MTDRPLSEDKDPTDWLAYLEATPHTEPYQSIARAWRADKAEIERLRKQRAEARVLLHDVSESTLPDRIHEFLKRTKERP